ncbi:MAG TPA: Crp/Fnr family transcriptional regulator [Solirubrobacteraceae bacterium]|nr:Crp/Fnr family transcriptional regulator [Solirubrobacteraceae bacterium]
MNDGIRILIEDPDLAAGIPAAERVQAARAVVTRGLQLDPGPWAPADGDRGVPLLLLSGFVSRDVLLAGRRSTQIYGPGDVLEPAEDGAAGVAHDVAWTVSTRATAAVLDERFLRAVRRWPSLAAAVSNRLLAQSARTAVHLAIAQLPRVEQRVLGILWHLADRWGRVTRDGVVVPLPLTHQALGRLVGAQRPTVSLALTELQQAGAVARTPDAGWLLDPTSRALLEAPPRTAAPVVPVPAVALADPAVAA